MDAQHRRCGTAKQKCCLLATALAGAMFFGTGLYSKPLFDALEDAKMYEQLRLDKPDSQFFKIWSDPSTQNVTIYMQINEWNITNPEAVLKGAKPALQLVGPWTYVERRKKHSMLYNVDESIIYYKQNRSFHLLDVPCPKDANSTTLCSLPESTMLNTMNIPLIGVAQQLTGISSNPDIVKTLMGVLLKFMNNASNPESLMQSRSAYEIVWGYDDGLVNVVNNINTLLKNLNIKIPVTIPKRYQLLQNLSHDEMTQTSAIYTGKDKTKPLTGYVEWAGNEGSLGNLWKGCDAHTNALANMINGTEGFQFSPRVNTSEPLYTFTEDLMRSSGLICNASEPPVDYHGMQLSRFRIDRLALANTTYNPSNCAYGGYGPNGVGNLTDYVGAPAFASKPYFLDADPVYLENITNFLPTEYAKNGVPREEYDTYVDIAPIIGTTFRAYKRLQINVSVLPVEGLNDFESIRPGGFYLPVMFANEYVELPEALVHQYQSQLGVAELIKNDYYYAGQIVGGIMIMVSLVLAGKLLRQSVEINVQWKYKNATDETSQLIANPVYTAKAQRGTSDSASAIDVGGGEGGGGRDGASFPIGDRSGDGGQSTSSRGAVPDSNGRGVRDV